MLKKLKSPTCVHEILLSIYVQVDGEEHAYSFDRAFISDRERNMHAHPYNNLYKFLIYT